MSKVKYIHYLSNWENAVIADLYEKVNELKENLARNGEISFVYLKDIFIFGIGRSQILLSFS